MHVLIDRARRADADDVFHAVEVVKLIAVDADGGHTHAGSHDGNALPFVGSRIALNAAHVVDQHRVGQIGFRDEFRAERVAGHQHGRREIAGVRMDVGGRGV